MGPAVKLVIGLGSNGRDRLQALRQAVFKLRTLPSFRLSLISPLYESEALLPPGAPQNWDRPYLNANVLGESELHPTDFLAELQRIEIELGRTEREKWAPREIDLDLLAADEQSLVSDFLTLPHPGLRHRPFALLPFLDLWPTWSFPKTKDHPKISLAKVGDKWTGRPPNLVPFQTRRSHHTLSELMAIVNCTPDSFARSQPEPSDPQNRSPQSSENGSPVLLDTFVGDAIDHSKNLVRSGATLLDIGGESTRPGASLISPARERSRIEPLLRALHPYPRFSEVPSPATPRRESSMRDDSPLKVSLDTRHPETLRLADHYPIRIVNDVSGLFHPEMIDAILRRPELDVVLMHSVSVPPRADERIPAETDPVLWILEWAERRIETLTQLGISKNKIIFDPGLGFGKSIDQNWSLVQNLSQFRSLGVRLLIGHSRKGFLDEEKRYFPSERDPETLALSVLLASKGVEYLRIHHYRDHQRALKSWARADGVVQCPS